MTPQSQPGKMVTPPALTAACFLVLATYGLLIDLKGISTDEGIRLLIINGGQPFSLGAPAAPPTWAMVLESCSPYAYQPLYFLMQNTLMRVAQTQDVVFFRLVNVFFLWVSLQGLLALSRTWQLVPRLFLIGVFSFNAYLLMHVLQLREYIVGVAFYVWSTWFVLRLDARELGREWADVAWFAAYGLLLTLGFYTQTWVVFPAIAQLLFLFVRRARASWHYGSHLAFSCSIVLCLTLPYLHAHHQKVDVGRWGKETTALWPQLSDGFHLVLTGHLAGHSRFTDFLFWFWLAVIAGALLLLLRPTAGSAPEVPPGEFKRQGSLMVLCILVPLAFQVGYFLKMDDLSVWPRYFIIHYFFLSWLVALAFKFLCDLRAAPGATAAKRRGAAAAVIACAAVMLASGVYQTRSYHQDPYLDTMLSPNSNWRTWAAELARVVQPGDVVLTYDLVSRATLSYTRPLPNRILPLKELGAGNVESAERVVYLEPSFFLSQRSQLAGRMAALGFATVREFPVHSADGKTILPDWRILAFSRR